MSKIEQVKLDLDQLAEVMGLTDTQPNWELTKRDNAHFLKKSVDIKWLEWDETGKCSGMHGDPEIGRSLIMSPFNKYFTWQTTDVTSFQTSEDGTEILFSTKNSNYILKRLTDGNSI